MQSNAKRVNEFGRFDSLPSFFPAARPYSHFFVLLAFFVAIQLRHDPEFFQTEIVRPAIGARIEERHKLAGLRVHRGDARAFAAIAVRAGQRQIRQGRNSAVLFRDDVVRLVPEQHAGLLGGLHHVLELAVLGLGFLELGGDFRNGFQEAQQVAGLHGVVHVLRQRPARGHRRPRAQLGRHTPTKLPHSF